MLRNGRWSASQNNAEKDVTIPAANRPHIFAFAPNAWRGPWMNRQQLLSRLAARGWPITYSTGALTVWERGTDDWNEAPWLGSHETIDGVRVDRPGKSQARWPRMRLWDEWAVKRHAATLLRQARRTRANAIAYVFHPSFYPYVDALRCRWLVYHAYDAYALAPGWNDELARMEAKLVARADLVVASSDSILTRLGAANRRVTMVVPNGADAAAFAAGGDLPCPPDLARIPRPRIAHIGRLNRKVDFRVVAETARQRPQWNWVLVGPVPEEGPGNPESDERIADAYRACRSLPNVHFLGFKPHTRLPAYAGHMDVNVLCYRRDEGWWTAGSPLKLHEYLASGKPVVSVEMDAVREFGGVVSIVSDVDGWIAAIERGIAGQVPATLRKRREVAFANSWDTRVDQLERALNALTGAETSAAPKRASPVRNLQSDRTADRA